MPLVTKITHIDEVNGDVDGDDRNGTDIDSIDEVNGDDGREGDGSPPLQLWIDAQWGCYNVALYHACYNMAALCYIQHGKI